MFLAGNWLVKAGQVQQLRPHFNLGSGRDLPMRNTGPGEAGIYRCGTTGSGELEAEVYPRGTQDQERPGAEAQKSPTG